jgi:ribonuclease E
MSKKILIDAKYEGEIRTALVNKNNIIEAIECESADTEQIKGNIYLAKVSRIEAALQAAFIIYDNDQSGFLPFNEIHPDFFILPNTKINTNSLKEIPIPQITPEEIGEYQNNEIQDLQEATAPIVALEKNIVSKVDLESVYDEIEDIKTQYQSIYKKYKIQDVIKKGQIILVQAQKERRGVKSASFTTFLSLAGKFCILMPNTPKQNCISRKIISQEERKRLKDIVSSIADDHPDSPSLIIRTAGIDRSSYEIKRDYEYLAKIWNRICNSAIKTVAPNIIHAEEAIITKTIRDMFDDKVSQVIIHGNKHYLEAIEFVRLMSPSAESKIIEHVNLEPIFASYGIEDQILDLYKPVVELPSGGYIVINPTEALTSIDINSGKAINERHIEETALKTNIEAAIQIARQIKLRDISGLIVVDFIDMHESKNRKIVENTFKEILSRDRAKIHVNNISNLGLIEVSRQRLRPSFLEKYSSLCFHCSGKGLIRSSHANAILILRTIERELISQEIHSLNIYAHVESVLYLLNKKRADISRIEREFKVEINFYQDKTATLESFSIEKIKLQQRQNKQEPDEVKVTKDLNKKTPKSTQKSSDAIPQQQKDIKLTAQDNKTKEDKSKEETLSNNKDKAPNEAERRKRVSFQKRRKAVNKESDAAPSTTHAE